MPTRPWSSGPPEPCEAGASLSAEQHAVDTRLVTLCANLQEVDLERLMSVPRLDHIQRERLHPLVAPPLHPPGHPPRPAPRGPRGGARVPPWRRRSSTNPSRRRKRRSAPATSPSSASTSAGSGLPTEL